MNKKIKPAISISFVFLCFFLLTLKAFSAEDVSSSVDVSKSTKTIILKDSDGDGLLDSEDPHPDVAEIYIVSDENKNGIVDSFEGVIDNNVGNEVVGEFKDNEE